MNVEMNQSSVFQQSRRVAFTGLFFAFGLPSVITGMIMAGSHAFESGVLASQFAQQFAYVMANWAAFGSLVFLLRRTIGVRLVDLGFKPRLTRGDGLATIAFAAAGIGLFIGLDRAFALTNLSMPIMEYHITSAGDIGILVLYATITAPICEEFFFRAYGISCIFALTHRRWLAILISLIAFGGIHLFSFGLRGFLEIGLIWGILPTTLYLWRKNIYPAIIMHSINTLFFYVLVPLYIPSLALVS